MVVSSVAMKTNAKVCKNIQQVVIAAQESDKMHLKTPHTSHGTYVNKLGLKSDEAM